MTVNAEQTTTLVLGGTGKTGSRVAERLRVREVPVRVGSRAADPPFDWDDRSTWEPALHGAAAAYVSFYPDLAVPGAPEAVAELAEVAMKTGTRRLVLLSGRGEVEAQRGERELQRSGADWTIVRAAWFNQNFSESYFVDPLIEGELALPAGDGGEPFVDAGDIADVAVAALTEEGHVGEVYELTGPRPLTFAGAVDEIARASGRELRYRTIPMADFEGALAAEQVPADGVQRALGREPRDFAHFASDAAAAGVGSRPAVAV